MKCRIKIAPHTDIAAWVTKDAFMANIDQEDLACRDSRDVLDWYHPDWFDDENGEQYFIPPAFGFWNGQLRGINGRHRTVLLYRHLEVIPMFLVKPGEWPRGKLAEIMQQEIGERETVELPDLPIKHELSKPTQLDLGDIKDMKGIVNININY